VTAFPTKTEEDKRAQQNQCLNLIVVLNNRKLKNYVTFFLLSFIFLFKSNENGQQQDVKIYARLYCFVTEKYSIKNNAMTKVTAT
jgi:hypothetical protein